MGREHSDSSEQLGFLQDETSTVTPKKEKCFGIPVYKVTLIREGKMPWGDTRMRNSAMVSAILHKYLEGTDRENLCAVLLDQKNQIIGISTWVFRKMTLAFIHAAFPLLPYESACNSRGSMSTKRQ